MVLLLGVLHINHTFRNFLFFGKKIKGMAFNKQIAHSTPIFANIQLLKIDDIRQPSSNIFSPLLCKMLAHGYSVRLASHGNLFLERKNTFQYGIRSMEYNGARLCNMIPPHTREASSPLVFKNNLKKYFLTQYDAT